MAELDIGKRCSHPSCQQLDFLPVQCSHCRQDFCKEHFGSDKHDCPKAINNIATDLVKTETYPCQFENCKKRELTSILCEHCSLQICLSHRHQIDHRCSKMEKVTDPMKATKKHVESLASTTSTTRAQQKKIRNPKAQKTAAKVQLMKLKMNSKGLESLPQEERVYFKVFYTNNQTNKSENVFISKNWSIGKIVDTLAESCSIVNKNNSSTKNQLKLYRYNDGQRIHESFDITLDRLIDRNIIYNGDSIVLTQSPDDDNDIIDLTKF